MRIERELLKEFIDFVDSYEFYPTERSVIWEIVNRANAILAQPEQEQEQEPVAWMWDKMFCEDWTTVSSVIKPSKSKYVDNVRPLYLTPPKREPLGLEIMDVCGSEDYREGFKDGEEFSIYIKGYARAEIDLKREPLSDEAIAKLWANKSPANEFECVRLVEKAHGIGGGE